MSARAAREGRGGPAWRATHLAHGSLALDLGSLGARGGLGLGLTGGLDGGALGLQFEQLLAGLLGLGLVVDLLALELAAGLLLDALGLVLGGGLLRVGGDLNGQLDRLEQGVAVAERT